MSKQKRNTIIFTIILSILAIALIVIFILDEMKRSGNLETKEASEIMEKFDKYYNSNEKEIIYYASSNCSYCELQTPILESIAEEYELDYYQIDSSKLGSKQKSEVLEKLNIEHATPTTVIVENGEVVDTLVGYTDGNEFIEFLVNVEILEEDASYPGEKYINFVSYEEYEKLIDNDLTNVITIGQTSCGHCIAFKPAINSVGEEYGLIMNYLNLTDLTEDENNKFFTSLTEIEYNDPDFIEDGSFGTPLTLIVKNGKVVDYISGQRTISQLVRELKKNGLISE